MQRFATIILLVLLILASVPSLALAQPPGKPTDPIPTPAGESAESDAAAPPQTSESLEPRVDLAAMALDSSDMPEGFTLFYEIYIPGDRVSAELTGGQITADEIATSGLQWYYESVYLSDDGSTRIRSYVQQYPDVAGATRGFELLEDENRLAPEGSIFTDAPGAGVGEQPAEISEGSLQPSGATPVVNSIDATFRTGNLLAGVSVDTLPEVPADRQIAIDLSAALFDRIQLVLASQPIPLIDDVLPGQMVSLIPGFRSHDEGYLSAPELYGPDAGAALSSEFVSGYFTNQSLVSTPDAPLPIPLVSISIGRFQSQDAALQALGDAPVLQPPFDSVEPLQLDPIPGAAVVQAVTYANPMLSAATRDSIRVVMVVGSNLVTIDVQANRTLEGAQQAAVQLAIAQAACLQSTSPCAPLELPAGLLEPPDLLTEPPPATPLPVG